jgi:hypothetical protein
MTDAAPSAPAPASLRADVAALFGEMAARVQGDVAYYERYARLYRRMANVLLVVAFLGLAVGTLAPLLHAMGLRLPGGGDLLALGYVALAVGGLALVLDRTLLATSNWRRFSTAKLALEGLNVRIWLEWSRYELAAHSAAGIEIRAGSVLDQLREFEAVRSAILEDEARDWADALQSARAEIERLIAARKPPEGAERFGDGERGRVPPADRGGAVRITLPPGEAASVHLVVAVGDITRELDAKPAQIVFGSVAAGTHAVRIRGHEDGRAVEFEDVVTVTAGATREVAIPAWPGRDTPTAREPATPPAPSPATPAFTRPRS